MDSLVNKMYDLIYYCDSYTAIGNGHLARAVNILNSLCSKSDYNSLKVGIAGNFNKSAIDFRDNLLNEKIIPIDGENWSNSNLVVLDTMFDPIDANHIDNDFCNHIKSKAKKLLLIEGVLGKIRLPNSVDIFINHLPDVVISGNVSCEQHIGFEYCPASSEFRSNNKHFSNDSNILIVLGSNKVQYGPEKLLKSLEAGMPNLNIEFIVSPLYEKKRLLKLKKKYKNVEFFQNVDSLIPHFEKASAIIGTYGHIVYESLTYHRPTFVVAYKEFQYEYARYLESKNLIVNLGYLDNLDLRKMKMLNNYEIKEKLFEQSKSHFNNPGIENVLKIIIQEI